MSCADDVLSMSELMNDYADRLTRSRKEKERIAAIRGALPRKPNGEVPLSWNRILEFLRGKARRVDAWEKDLVRTEVRRLAAAARLQREQEHLTWLASELGRLEASGEEFHGAHVDGLKHFLRLARGADSSVAVQEEGGAK